MRMGRWPAFSAARGPIGFNWPAAQQTAECRAEGTGTGISETRKLTTILAADVAG